MILRSVLIAATAAFFVATEAIADTLSTTHVFDSVDSQILCRVTNVSNKTVVVEVQLISLVNSVVDDDTFTLGPGEGNGMGTVIGSQLGHLRCAFTIQGRGQSLRAALQVLDDVTSTTIATLPAT